MRDKWFYSVQTNGVILRVLSKGKEYVGDGTRQFANIEYKYQIVDTATVDRGRTMVLSQVVHGEAWARMEEGDQITVRYSPKRPHMHILEPKPLPDTPTPPAPPAAESPDAPAP